MKTRRPELVPFYECLLPADAETRDVLRRAERVGRLCADHFLVRGDRLVLPLSGTEIDLLCELGVPVEVGRDLREHARRVRSEVAPLPAGTDDDTFQSGFVTSYLDSAGIAAAFAALHAEFPALTEWTALPFNTAGYDGVEAGLAGPAPIELFRITTTPASLAKPGLLYIGGCHAREWIPPVAALELAQQLLRNYQPGSADPAIQAINALVEGLDILIVPAMNPDGINYSHHDDAMWRKNRRSNLPSLCKGADLNRNYSIYWGQAGSSGDPCDYQTYHGPAPLSEPENRAIEAIVEQHPNILVAVDCHSAGEKLLRPQPTGGTFIASEPVEAFDHDIYLTLEAAMNAAISAVSPGKTYLTGSTSNHAGTTDEYLFFAHRIYAFDLETAQEFQPPLAAAQTSALEVAAAVRALGAQALTLASQFTTPVSVVHVIDKSSSMIGSGYVDPTRANARRLIDLMSLNDRVGVVSFNEASAVELPLTALTGPGVFATARGAVDGIAFGGWTSIGAGLQAGGDMVAPGPGHRALILLSDGYQNRPPTVETALPLLPAGVRVFTIALGPDSDQGLLQTIADTTGGTYVFSPDEMELYEIYNFIRAEADDDQVILNETFDLPAGGDDTVTRSVLVDPGAAHALFSVATLGAVKGLEVTLEPPCGWIRDLSRVRHTVGEGYQVLRVRRPQAGRWTLRIRNPHRTAARCNAAAFLRSELRLRLASAKAALGAPLRIRVGVREGEERARSFRGTASVAIPAASLRALGKLARGLRVPPEAVQGPDPLPDPVLTARLAREKSRRETGADLWAHRTALVPPLAVDFAELAGGTECAPSSPALRTEAELVLPEIRTPGSYNARLRVEGIAEPSGLPYVRLGLRSVWVG